MGQLILSIKPARAEVLILVQRATTPVRGHFYRYPDKTSGDKTSMGKNVRRDKTSTGKNVRRDKTFGGTKRLEGQYIRRQTDRRDKTSVGKKKTSGKEKSPFDQWGKISFNIGK
jgi:hypothetical protein